MGVLKYEYLVIMYFYWWEFGGVWIKFEYVNILEKIVLAIQYILVFFRAFKD